MDRAKARGGEDEEGEESDKVQRVKALEEMMKLSQIDEETFVKLREEILGDQVGERAALVKGLDWRLLERVRRGEVGVKDVLGDTKGEDDEGEEEGEGVDEEFEDLDELVGNVESVVKEKVKKKGEMAPPELTGKKRNRDQILQEMKAARLAAKEAAKPSLGAKFKKFGEKRVESRIERDGKGREVLITVDEHGNEKRKVRRVQIEEPVEKDLGLLMPDKDAKPLGMEVPEIPKVEEEEEDIDIFDDVGDDYDPLAGLIDSDSASEAEAETEEGEVSEDPKPTAPKPTTSNMPPPPRPAQKPRNYFSTPTSSTSEPTPLDRPKALTDPTLLAAIKKASTLNPVPKAADDAAKDAKRKKMLQQDDRDAQDMDMGFGSSRFEDEADGDETKIKLSEWGGGDDDDEGGKKGGDKGKRKRGPKKRKGDANSAADVLAVMERRKGEKK